MVREHNTDGTKRLTADLDYKLHPTLTDDRYTLASLSQTWQNTADIIYMLSLYIFKHLSNIMSQKIAKHRHKKY